MTNLCFGWKAGAEQYPPNDLLDYAIAADEAGFDLLDVSDHFHPWSQKGQASFAWTWLGAVAARTHRIRLGPGVTCPVLRYHPSIIAQAAATLATMAPHRVFVGLGTGEALNEYAAVGLWPEHPLRQAMLGEAISLMRMLWTGEEVSFGGDYFVTHQARLYTAPEEAPPIYVSSMTPKSARFAGATGDGLFTTGGKQPEVYRKLIGEFEAGAGEAGKDPSKMPRVIEIQVSLTDDAEGAIEGMKQYWAGAMLPALFNRKIYSPAESAENGALVGSDTIRQKLCISPDPGEHIRYAQQYIDLGFDHLVFHCPGPDQLSFIENYSRNVLPELRNVVRAAA